MRHCTIGVEFTTLDWRTLKLSEEGEEGNELVTKHKMSMI